MWLIHCPSIVAALHTTIDETCGLIAVLYGFFLSRRLAPMLPHILFGELEAQIHLKYSSFVNKHESFNSPLPLLEN